MTQTNGQHVIREGSRTAGYRPTLSSSYGWGGGLLDADGVWTRADIEAMDADPRVQVGLRILCAPVYAAQWTVLCTDQTAGQFIQQTLKRFWTKEATKVVPNMLRHGSMGGEVVYRHDPDQGLWQFSEIKDFHLNDVRPLELRGELVGVRIWGVPGQQTSDHDPMGDREKALREGGKGTVDLLYPAGFWAANSPEYSCRYGISRYRGAWKPWKEKRGKHGAVDVRRTWFLKDVFRGGMMRYPEGESQDDTGQWVDNQDIAREIVEKAEAGHIMALPGARDEKGNPLWEYIEPKVNGEPTSLIEYPKLLDREILEGMGIMPEVLEAAEVGAGWSGRALPFIMFLKSEDEIVGIVLDAFVRQVITPLVQVNFGPQVQFTIEPVSLVPKPQPPAQGGAPGQVPGGQPPPGPEQGAGGGPGEAPQPEDLLGGGQAGQGGMGLSQEDWTQERGERGGHKWRNRKTGAVEYGENNPGGEGRGTRATTSPKPPGSSSERDPHSVLATFKKAYAAIKNTPAGKLVRSAYGKLRSLQKRLQAGLEKRYGPKTAKAILLSGMVADAAVTGGGALLGKVILVPGLSILGTLPAVILAEGWRQARRLAGAKLAMDEGDLTEEQIASLGRKVRARLQAELEGFLRENRQAMQEAGGGDLKLSAVHAPAGGATVGGKEYTGGEFIPGEVLAKATKKEKAALESKAKVPKTNKKKEVAPKKERIRATRGPMAEARRVGEKDDARVVLANGQPAPAHIKPSMVPPGWTEVKVSTDPDADVLVTARDKAGRVKTVYRDDFHMKTAAAKFARVKELLDNRIELHARNQQNRLSTDPRTRDAADCVWLMETQGTRPGSESSPGAKVKAYGATTLEGRHVVRRPDGSTWLRFIGKEGVLHQHRVRDPELARMLKRRKATAGDDGQLFGINENAVNKYMTTLAGGKYTAKDLRTLTANRLALQEIVRAEAPATEKEYKKAVKAVAEVVSGVLGNRPAQALESYIDPTVFSRWRAGLESSGKE